jgi:hypothetical protein
MSNSKKKSKGYTTRERIPYYAFQNFKTHRLKRFPVGAGNDVLTPILIKLRLFVTLRSKKETGLARLTKPFSPPNDRKDLKTMNE